MVEQRLRNGRAHHGGQASDNGGTVVTDECNDSITMSAPITE